MAIHEEGEISPDGNWIWEGHEWMPNQLKNGLEELVIGENIQLVGSERFPDSNSIWRINYREYVENHGYFVSTSPEPTIEYEKIMFLLEKPDSKTALATFVQTKEISDSDIQKTAMKKGLSKDEVISKLRTFDWTMIHYNKEWKFTEQGVTKKKKASESNVEKILTELHGWISITLNNIFR